MADLLVAAAGAEVPATVEVVAPLLYPSRRDVSPALVLQRPPRRPSLLQQQLTHIP